MWMGARVNVVSAGVNVVSVARLDINHQHVSLEQPLMQTKKIASTIGCNIKPRLTTELPPLVN